MSHAFTMVKVVVFSILQKKLSIYYPNKALPRAKKISRTSLDSIAQNLIQDCLHINTSDIYVEQLYSFSSESNEEIDVVYYVLVSSYTILNSCSNWREIEAIQKNEPDWDKIHYALQRLRWKIEYTNVVYSLLPKEFTLSELQMVYEAILGKLLDKRNFRKKILSLKMLQPSNHVKTGMKARPAMMYQFKEKRMVMVNVF